MNPIEPSSAPTPSPRVSACAVGREMDGWRLEALIHQGQAGEVWRVCDASQEDAPTQILKIAHSSPDAQVRLELEHSLLTLLSGPHVPRVLGHGEVDGQAYVRLEHLPGRSLQERIQTHPLGLDELIELACQLAIALHQVHRQGALHLDLQPRHIMFRDSGEVVLLGWGLARHDQHPDLHDNTLDLDSGAYLSPEQIHWQRHDLRSDLFAWAVVTYECLTGRLPFGQPHTPSELRQRLALQPLPPRALRSECPDWLQEALLRNLDARADERHPNAAHLLWDLRFPDRAQLTPRAEALTPARRSPWWRRLQSACRAWLEGDLARPPSNPLPGRLLAWQLHHHPVVVVLVDFRQSVPDQSALRRQLEWMLTGVPHARLACIALQDTVRSTEEATPQPLSIPGVELNAPAPLSPLIQLQYWAHPLIHHSEAPCLGGVSFHVIDCTDSGGLRQWLREHVVDHVLLSANSPMAHSLGPISPCTITFVAPAQN